MSRHYYALRSYIMLWLLSLAATARVRWTPVDIVGDEFPPLFDFVLCSDGDSHIVFGGKDAAGALSGSVYGVRVGDGFARVVRLGDLGWGLRGHAGGHVGQAALGCVSFGGLDHEDHVLNKVLAVSPNGRVLDITPAGGPGARYGSAAAAGANGLYVVGGRDVHDRTHCDIWLLSPAERAPDNSAARMQWSLVMGDVPDGPPGRLWHAMAFNGPHLVVQGGEVPLPDPKSSSSQVLDDTWSFDVGCRKWTPFLGAISTPRSGHSLLSLPAGSSSCLVMFGGEAPDRSALSDTVLGCDGFDIWVEAENLLPSPSPRLGHRVSPVVGGDSGRFVVFGGVDWSDLVTDRMWLARMVF